MLVELISALFIGGGGGAGFLALLGGGGGGPFRPFEALVKVE
jgi:hypothetical protein